MSTEYGVARSLSEVKGYAALSIDFVQINRLLRLVVRALILLLQKLGDRVALVINHRDALFLQQGVDLADLLDVQLGLREFLQDVLQGDIALLLPLLYQSRLRLVP